jgi:glycogen operon protein
MYAGRNLEDTQDDIVFYGMNSYWEPLTMRLPNLPQEYRWKVVVNTFCEYEDGADFDALTECENNIVRIPERSTLVLVAESVHETAQG